MIQTWIPHQKLELYPFAVDILRHHYSKIFKKLLNLTQFSKYTWLACKN